MKQTNCYRVLLDLLPTVRVVTGVAWNVHRNPEPTLTLSKRVPDFHRNLAVTAHRCLWSQAPTYLADYCIPMSEVAGRQHLRSARRLLDVSRVRRAIGRNATLRPPVRQSGIHCRTIFAIRVRLSDRTSFNEN